MANRNTLHKSRLDALKEWLIAKGWEIHEPRGDYEALRATHTGKKFPLIVFWRNFMPEHLSVMDRDIPIIWQFIQNQKLGGKNNEIYGNS